MVSPPLSPGCDPLPSVAFVGPSPPVSTAAPPRTCSTAGLVGLNPLGRDFVTKGWIHLVSSQTAPLFCTHLFVLQLVLLGEDGHPGSQVLQLLPPGLWEEGTRSCQLTPGALLLALPVALGFGRAVCGRASPPSRLHWHLKGKGEAVPLGEGLGITPWAGVERVAPGGG